LRQPPLERSVRPNNDSIFTAPQELAALQDFGPANDRSGSFASILPCPRCCPLPTTPDMTTSDQEPRAFEPLNRSRAFGRLRLKSSHVEGGPAPADR
jgi:hypothetical protein